ncbi:M64 family metallo-endopeptidase [Xanthomarina sp. F1114]|uniref:T9SS type A sorting domain-containing protein n=1 Tax=Xanthomarina sp. F1114 TaxID=2996019 RepID=UPI00225E1387|nr:M64 family metallopeptidase [Xanthomarina sp. F1114]MCX7547891.1 M64 family metallo-endopeptidase [Xanthomarina sp. F1114]
MKHTLLSLLTLLVFQISFAQVFEGEYIKYSGDMDNRINIVIMGDGYQASEFDKFETDASNFMTDLFSQSPFSEYSDYFNVYIIKVPSNESGASHPGNANDIENCADVPITVVDNYFGTSYDSYGTHRLLYTENSATIMSVLADNFPLYDQGLLLVNAPYYGGSGGAFPIASTGEYASEIAIHEIGHSLVNLKDEYYPGDILAEEGINMTQETNPDLVKWTNWIASNGVGIYAYCPPGSGACSTWYRPHQACKMRVLGNSFCAVCKEGVIEKIHDLVSPIDAYSPNSSPIEDPNFPLEFNLFLNSPLPNTLESSWSLNSNAFASDVDHISLLESDVTEGANSLTVVVTDNTPLQRIDNHETIHAYTVNWNINMSTIGIAEVTSEENNLSISMFPNPSQDLVNFSFKNTLGADLTIEIISLDGKKILTTDISNNENSTIDISTFSAGVYLVNFYSNKVLIANKKLIKN